MFNIRDNEREDQTDLNCSRSKYFIPGSILNNKSDKKRSEIATNESVKEQTIGPNLLSDNKEPEIESNDCSRSCGQTRDIEKRNESSDNKKTTSNTIPKAISIGSTILVNPNQSGNKLLKCFRFVGYEFSESISPAHYVMFQSCCAMFLSLKYHAIYPNYIYDKLTELRNVYQLKVLLVLVDHIEFETPLKELTKLAVRTGSTLMLAWSYEEAAHYLENYKQFCERPPDIIMGKSNTNNTTSQSAYQSLVEALTSVKSINKTDAISLISMFERFQDIATADEEELTICPGMAALKAQRLRQLINKPFIRLE